MTLLEKQKFSSLGEHLLSEDSEHPSAAGNYFHDCSWCARRQLLGINFTTVRGSRLRASEFLGNNLLLLESKVRNVYGRSPTFEVRNVDGNNYYWRVR